MSIQETSYLVDKLCNHNIKLMLSVTPHGIYTLDYNYYETPASCLKVAVVIHMHMHEDVIETLYARERVGDDTRPAGTLHVAQHAVIESLIQTLLQYLIDKWC